MRMQSQTDKTLRQLRPGEITRMMRAQARIGRFL